MNHKLLRSGFLLSAFFLGLVVSGPAMPATDTSVEGDTIAWFRGDVEQAFAMAKAQNKPLFLYWGAVWCPYCARIKSSVFQSRQFIALSELFVPYYLDGDTEQAQAVGDRFGVRGYPTMIVLNPEGEEITRIPGGIDIDRYNSVLRHSLDSMQSTNALLARATSDPGSLSAAEYTQLAYYSWGQDSSVLEESTDPELFRRLSEQARAVDEIASARLFMQYLAASTANHSEESPVQLAGADGRLEAILESDELTLACWDTLAYSPEILDILAINDARKQSLRKLWTDRTFALRHDPVLTIEEQLGGWRPILIFHFEETDDPISTELEALLDADIAAANEAVSDPYQRQGLVHQMKWTYQYAHMNDKARDLMLAELDRSVSPYYFMSGLGSLAEEEGDTAQALEWYRKAWNASVGTATRFQWGTNYIRALIRMAPENAELIGATATAVIDELADQRDAFNNRNLRRLRSISDAMSSWAPNEDAKRVSGSYFARIEAMCATQVEGSPERENCEALQPAAGDQSGP